MRLQNEIIIFLKNLEKMCFDNSVLWEFGG